MLKYLLDTNIVIYVLKRRPLELLQVFNNHTNHMAISAITLGELLHGVEKSSQPVANLNVVEDFCSRVTVLPYAAKAAQHYGAIRAALEKIGQPIGVNDFHIAAHARSEGLILVTNNIKEFVKVPALQLENWLAAPEK
ncbi:type II toxin-antitoxin system tRNA(fMet)-specific endonuclease VapC [Solimicrobium silvestre]|uniref:Ribonuclease VapC n=1 Tax=Solimicrobium silvestre TaxID=2099400 RepID=A0A2S9H4P3_9BURK|nr:type II toxin-antitoxin system VapC family toxin [Solimicrobium silvestre]PRC94949.1 putative nucleic acid-binding protein contains PIN domain [Solimicrobium silvestre]